MKVPSPTQGQTKPSALGMDYLKGALPDISPIIQGLNAISASASALAQKKQVDADQLKKFKALSDFNNFQLGATDLMTSLKKSSDPSQGNFAETADSEFVNYGNKFIETVDPTLQEEYKVRVSEVGQHFGIDARKFQEDETNAYYNKGVDKVSSEAAIAVEQDPQQMEAHVKAVDEMIDKSGWSLLQKAEARYENHKRLEGIAYRKDVEDHKVKTQGSTSDLSTVIKRGAAELGINPIDLATVISYETGGKFSTSIRGGKDNKYIGLIQFGPAEQIKYGARQGQSYDEQMTAVVAYLKDRGFKPGMSLLDLYSTINAGSPGKYGASDSPGNTVASHVANMGDHQKKAAELLGGTYEVPDNIDENPRYAEVPYEDRIALRKQADTNASDIIRTQNAAIKAKQEQAINALKVGVFDGTLGQKDLDQFRELGVVTDFNDIKTVQDMIDKREADGLDLRKATEKLNSGGLWDLNNTDDKKGMNLLYGDSGDVALSNADSEYFQNVLKPLSRAANMIPPNAIGRLDSLARDMNPKKAAFGLNALSDLHNNLPDAYERQVPDDVKKNVDFWEQRKDLPLGEKEVFDIIAGRMTPEQRNAREQLLKEADTMLNDPKNDHYTTFDTVLNSMTPDTMRPFESTAQAPVWASARLAMQDEWKTLLKENYVKMGDWDQAQTASIKQLSRTWGITNFGGRQTLMKWPPEKVGYRPIDGSMQWTEDQARSELKIMPDVPIQLISDDTTQGQFFASQAWDQQGYGSNVLSGAIHAMRRPTPPSYLVAVQGPDGWQLATNANGDIIRQHFDITPALQTKEETSFKVKQMEDDLHQKFMRFTEAAAHSQVTGVPVPKEIVDDYNNARVVVDKAKEDLTKKVQGPTQTGTPKAPFQQPGTRGQNVIRTLEGYPSPAIGMLAAGNLKLTDRPVRINPKTKEKGTVYSMTIEDEGHFILIPSISTDGQWLNKEEATDMYYASGKHLGVFSTEEAANKYAKELSDMQGKRLGL